MPMHLSPSRTDGKMAWRFSLAGSIGFDGDKVAEAIMDQRKMWQKHRDDMLHYQKECAKEKDFEFAKFFKEEAAWAMKHYRAACLLVPYVCAHPPGDCPYRDLYEIGPELHPYLSYLENLCICKADPEYDKLPQLTLEECYDIIRRSKEVHNKTAHNCTGEDAEVPSQQS